jgi:hypothetical protein
MQVSRQLDLLILECDPKVANELKSGWAESGMVVRTLRGRKMRTEPTLFNEFAAALQFPWYFGENASAFDECLADLGWLPAQSGYVLVITDPNDVLADTGEDLLAWLVGSLTHACEQWAQPIALGEWWDRPPVPFHVVLQSVADETAKAIARWTEAGAVVSPLPA